MARCGDAETVEWPLQPVRLIGMYAAAARPTSTTLEMNMLAVYGTKTGQRPKESIAPFRWVRQTGIACAQNTLGQRVARRSVPAFEGTGA